MKKVLIASMLALGLSTTSCLGPDNTYNSIKNWNAELSEQDWVNEIVFLGLTIIPVYGFSLLLDTVVFNTIGYWGTNPITAPRPFPGFSNND